MSSIVSDLTAYVIAGGQSRRMGKDKAFLPWGRGTLLTHAVELASQVTADVKIVGDPRKFANATNVIADIYSGCGPLGGIHAALTHSTTPFNLMLAVDIPLIDPRFLLFMAGLARNSQAMVLVPRSKEGSQPLCAIYHNDFVEVAEKALSSGEYKIDPLFAKVEVRAIEAEELRRAGFSDAMFRNLNTPEDWEAVQGHPPAI